MSLSTDICKINPDCSYVIPIDERSSIGNAISSINLNFRNLDIATCNLETSANDYYNVMYSTFANLSASFSSLVETVQTKSACWQDSYTQVNELSSFWLKPISIIYPFPFEGTEENTTETITAWLNENFPTKTGSCFNFILGQELYVFSSRYQDVNRILESSSTATVTPTVEFAHSSFTKGNDATLQRERALWRFVGVAANGSRIPAEEVRYGGPKLTTTGNTTIVRLTTYFPCIKSAVTRPFNLEFKLPEVKTNTTVPDKYIQQFAGLKYVIDETSYLWKFDSTLYNFT